MDVQQRILALSLIHIYHGKLPQKQISMKQQEDM